MIIVVMLFALCLMDCNNPTASKSLPAADSSNIMADTSHYAERTLAKRILTPAGFEQQVAPEGSFQEYLRNIPLRKKGSKVRYYDGREKLVSNVYCEVVDLPIGNNDLHQCAVAVMRLRAEYLWRTQQYDQIHFNFTNGFRVDYSEWMKGRRMIVNGNTTNWNNRHQPSNTYEDFWKYMELIFTYAGTASLEKELMPVPFAEMRAGDVLIQGGHPGHAVIVMDMAVNKQTGVQKYLLAQSYMPAQELQVLVNPKNKNMSPWYELDSQDMISTPEWTFSRSNLRRFAN